MACPASLISIDPKGKRKKSGKKSWRDYFWISSSAYLILGFFNILFAWLGLVCFMTPLLISIIKGNKAYCNKYCGRGQIFENLGGKLGISLGNKPPKFLSSKWFRYGFLTFFMSMFALMIYRTYLVYAGAPLQEVVTLLWVFKIPWGWTLFAPANGYASVVAPWIAQFAFGFYGVMLTSTVLGLVTMILCKPRTWCIYCPMGTMTQGICTIKNRKKK